MGQQSNKVQKRRRRLNYQKRKKLASKTATAKPAASGKTSTTPAKKAAASKPAAAMERAVAASQPEKVNAETLTAVKE